MRSLLGWDRTAAISVGLAVCAWLFDAALDSFVFRLGPLHQRLFPLNDPNEIWQRAEAIGIFLILSVYCHVIIAQRKRAEAEQVQAQLREREAHRCCDQAVRVRDAFVALINANTEEEVVAVPEPAFHRIQLRAKVPGPEGNGITFAATTDMGDNANLFLILTNLITPTASLQTTHKPKIHNYDRMSDSEAIADRELHHLRPRGPV